MSDRFTAAQASWRSPVSCTRWMLTCLDGGSVRGSCRPGASMDDLRRFVLSRRGCGTSDLWFLTQFCFFKDKYTFDHTGWVWTYVFIQLQVVFVPLSFQMCATRGGCWLRWKSSAGFTGSTRPSCERLFWPAKMRKREGLLIDRETWWAVRCQTKVCVCFFSCSICQLQIVPQN